MEPVPKVELITGDLLEAIKGDSQDLVDFAFKNFGVTLAYNDESILWLSSFIEEDRNKMDTAMQHTFSIKIGIFLGFAIIHKHGGEWVRTEDNNLAVRFPSGGMAFPYNKASKQFENGITDNIFGLYRNMGFILNRNADKQRTPPNAIPPIL